MLDTRLMLDVRLLCKVFFSKLLLKENSEPDRFLPDPILPVGLRIFHLKDEILYSQRGKFKKLGGILQSIFISVYIVPFLSFSLSTSCDSARDRSANVVEMIANMQKKAI